MLTRAVYPAVAAPTPPPDALRRRRRRRQTPPPRGSRNQHMLDSLSQRLARVVKTMRGEARLTEANTQEMLREIRIALLEADVSLPVVREFVARVQIGRASCRERAEKAAAAETWECQRIVTPQ